MYTQKPLGVQDLYQAVTTIAAFERARSGGWTQLEIQERSTLEINHFPEPKSYYIRTPCILQTKVLHKQYHP